jgi:hypothetical protein
MYIKAHRYSTTESGLLYRYYYALKEKEFPQASRQKYQAHKIFTGKLFQICFKYRIVDKIGIVKA